MTAATTTEPVVELAGVSKRYASPGGGLDAVAELDLTAQAGEFLAIVGPSGCGKTTVLRMLQGLETPTGGHVRIGGSESAAPEVGFVFQQPSLFPWWTVRQNVAFGLRLAARAGQFSAVERDTRVGDMLALVGLEQFADYSPRQLSGGMQQRVNLARALAIEPRVLLLDEPFSAVDALNRERLQVTLSGLLGQLGTTAVMVTHDIREAVFLGSRVVVMSARPGRVTATFDVDVPRPRTTEFQRSMELAALAQQVYGSLAQAEKVLSRMQNNRRRRLSRTVPTAVALALLTACGSAASSSAPTGVTSPGKPGAAPETTSLSMPATAVSAADGPLEYSVTGGYFARKGLSVSVPLSAEAQVKEAVATGSAPLDNLAGSDVLDLYGKGLGVETIGCTAASNGFYVYAKKGVSASSLSGKIIGVPSIDGAPQFAMDYFSDSHGTSPSRLAFTPLGSIPNVLAALEAGRIDVALLSTPFNLKASAAGFTDLGYAVGPPTPYVVNKSWAARNGATITSWIEAFDQGTWRYFTDKKAAEAELSTFLKLAPSNPADAKVLAGSWKNYLPPVTEPLGECRASSFAPYVKYFPASERGQLKNLGSLVDNQYVDQLWKSGFYSGLQARYGPVPGLTLQQVVLRQPSLVNKGGRPAAAP